MSDPTSIAMISSSATTDSNSNDNLDNGVDGICDNYNDDNNDNNLNMNNHTQSLRNALQFCTKIMKQNVSSDEEIYNCNNANDNDDNTSNWIEVIRARFCCNDNIDNTENNNEMNHHITEYNSTSYESLSNDKHQRLRLCNTRRRQLILKARQIINNEKIKNSVPDDTPFETKSESNKTNIDRQQKNDRNDCHNKIHVIDNINDVSCSQFWFQHQIVKNNSDNRYPCLIRNVQDIILSLNTIFSNWIIPTNKMETLTTTSSATSESEIVVAQATRTIDNQQEKSSASQLRAQIQDNRGDKIKNYSINRKWFQNVIQNEVVLPVRILRRRRKHNGTIIGMDNGTMKTTKRNQSSYGSSDNDIQVECTDETKVMMKLSDWFHILDWNRKQQHVSSHDNNNGESSLFVVPNDNAINIFHQTLSSDYDYDNYYLKDWHFQSWFQQQQQSLSMNDVSRSNSIMGSDASHHDTFASNDGTIIRSNNDDNTRMNDKKTIDKYTNIHQSVILRMNLNNNHVANHSETNDDSNNCIMYNVLNHFQYDLLNNFLLQYSIDYGDYRFVYWGPLHSKTFIHTDVMNSFSWSYNVYGTKEWKFYYINNTGHTNNNNDIDLDNSNHNNDNDTESDNPTNEVVVTVIQKAGELMFVPPLVKHSVINLEETISINHNWVTTANIHMVWECIVNEIDSIDSELVKWDNSIIDNNNYEIKENMLRGCFGLDLSSFVFMILVRLIEIIIADKQLMIVDLMSSSLTACTNKDQSNSNDALYHDFDNDNNNDHNEYSDDRELTQLQYYYEVLKLVDMVTLVSQHSDKLQLLDRLTATLQSNDLAEQAINIIKYVVCIFETPPMATMTTGLIQ